MNASKYIKMVAISLVNIAMLIGLCGAVFGLSKPNLIFSESMELYGPLRNNLIFILLYISVSEIALFFLQFYKRIVTESMIIGLIMILIAFGTILYSQINQIPFSIVMFVGCLFIGVAHLFYYFVYQSTEKT